MGKNQMKQRSHRVGIEKFCYFSGQIRNLDAYRKISDIYIRSLTQVSKNLYILTYEVYVVDTQAIIRVSNIQASPEDVANLICCISKGECRARWLKNEEGDLFPWPEL